MAHEDLLNGHERSELFKKTGLLFAGLLSLYVLIIYIGQIFKLYEKKPLSFDMFLLLIMAAVILVFIASALYEHLNWLQPVLLLFITPLPMFRFGESMFSLGAFSAATILLYRLGFFEKRRVLKFMLIMSYYYFCQLLVGITVGAPLLSLAMPLIFMTIFIMFLLLVFREKWIIYIQNEKPQLSLSQIGITKTEAEYLRETLAGKTFKEIAIDMQVKESTVRNTLARVYKKIGVTDKAGLATKCEKYTIIE